jgi:hypothetical protein
MGGMPAVLTLDERIIRDLKARQQQLEEEGKLPSRQQLAQYRAVAGGCSCH